MTSLEEAVLSSRVVCSDSLSSCASDTASDAGIRSDRCDSSCFSGSLSSYAGSVSSSPSRESRLVMDDRDKGIYNRLGSKSGTEGKPTYIELGLNRGIQKRGIMSKTGPAPSWYSLWKKRLFVLKGNFLFYFEPNQPIDLMSTPALGAVYLKNAVISKTSMPFARKVLTVTPPVPRRRGWEEDDRSSIFYISFKTEQGRMEWYEELQQVAFCNRFPSKKSALITKSMKFNGVADSNHSIE